jgi:hypothetical protein
MATATMRNPDNAAPFTPSRSDLAGIDLPSGDLRMGGIKTAVCILLMRRLLLHTALAKQAGRRHDAEPSGLISIKFGRSTSGMLSPLFRRSIRK